jgi:hypothetical protein
MFKAFMEVIMKSMVKILFAIMALSLGEVSVSAVGRGKRKDNPVVVAEAQQNHEAFTQAQRLEILECLAQTIIEALKRSMLDTKTGESLLQILTELDKTGSAITFMSSGTHAGAISEFTNAANFLGITALVQAIDLNNTDSVRVLLPITNLRQELHVGDSTSKTTYLHLACQQDNDAIFDMVLAELLKQCPETAQKEDALSTKNSQGFTVAETALNLDKHDRLTKLARLPECPMFVGRNRGGKSLLHLAIERRNTAGLTTLIAPDVLAAHQDDDLVNAADTAGNTAVHYAALAIELENNKEFFTILHSLVANEDVPTTNKPHLARTNTLGQTAIMLITNPVVRASLVKTYPVLTATILQQKDQSSSQQGLTLINKLRPSTFVAPTALVLSSAVGYAVGGFAGAAVPTATGVVYFLWQNLKNKVDLTATAASIQAKFKRSKKAKNVIINPTTENETIVLEEDSTIEASAGISTDVPVVNGTNTQHSDDDV